MEQRTADTLKRKDDAEREIKDRKVKAYLDPAKAEIAREEGNELFKQQKYPEAVERYTEAIKRDPEDHRVYSNRAACYTKLTAFNEALKDAEKCIALKPDFPKGYTRKGHVEFFTKQYDKALETYQLGLSKDPANEELKDGLRRTMIEIQKGQTGQVDEAEMKQRQERAMQDPEIQNILSDPVMRQVLNDMSTDPKAAAEHQKNPMVMAKIQKLINAGIVQAALGAKRVSFAIARGRNRRTTEKLFYDERTNFRIYSDERKNRRSFRRCSTTSRTITDGRPSY